MLKVKLNLSGQQALSSCKPQASSSCLLQTPIVYVDMKTEMLPCWQFWDNLNPTEGQDQSFVSSLVKTTQCLLSKSVCDMEYHDSGKHLR